MPRKPRKSTFRKLLFVQTLLLLSFVCEEESFPRPWFGFELERLISSKSFGKGNGKGPRRRTKRIESVDVFEKIKENNPHQLEKLIHLNMDEFETLAIVLRKSNVDFKLGLLYFSLFLLKY